MMLSVRNKVLVAEEMILIFDLSFEMFEFVMKQICERKLLQHSSNTVAQVGLDHAEARF